MIKVSGIYILPEERENWVFYKKRWSRRACTFDVFIV